MFPVDAFGVGVTVASLEPFIPSAVVPARVTERPTRLGELLPVREMTPEQKAAQLRRVVEAEAQLAAYKAELVVALAWRPAGAGRSATR